MKKFWSNLPSQGKKDIVKFLAAGTLTLVASIAERSINRSAELYFGPDEEPKKKPKTEK